MCIRDLVGAGFFLDLFDGDEVVKFADHAPDGSIVGANDGAVDPREPEAPSSALLIGRVTDQAAPQSDAKTAHASSSVPSDSSSAAVTSEEESEGTEEEA